MAATCQTRAKAAGAPTRPSRPCTLHSSSVTTAKYCLRVACGILGFSTTSTLLSTPASSAARAPRSATWQTLSAPCPPTLPYPTPATRNWSSTKCQAGKRSRARAFSSITTSPLDLSVSLLPPRVSTSCAHRTLVPTPLRTLPTRVGASSRAIPLLSTHIRVDNRIDMMSSNN
jgi:hypothetical protein